MVSRTTVRHSVGAVVLLADRLGPDMKLDNIQITLPDDEDAYLDAFYGRETSPPSLSKLGSEDNPGVASREMSSAIQYSAIWAQQFLMMSNTRVSSKRCRTVPRKSFSGPRGTIR